MTTQQELNKARVRDYIGNVVNKHVRDRFPEYIAEESVDHSAPAGMPGGPEGTRMFFSMFYDASSDMSNEICEMMAEDDAVAFVSIVSGTHSGVLMGMPPTNKKFRMLLIETVRLRDGKYIEHWGGMDIAAMMAQIGSPADVDLVAALPPVMPATPADATGSSREAVDANKALVRAMFDVVFVQRDLTRLGEFFATPLRGLNQMAIPEGLEQIQGYFQTYLDAFPDMTVSLDGVMGENDLIALRLDMKGTHQGAFMGAPATGKSFAVSAMHVFRITDGKISERWEWVDLTALFQQLGIQPGAPAQDDAVSHAEQVRWLVETYIAGVNEHDPSKLRLAFAADFKDNMNTPAAADVGQGVEAVVAAHELLHGSFPDIKFYVDEMTIQDDMVAIRVHAEGTHTGQFYMFPPTNKQITWTAHRILRVANGQFVESWNEFDQVFILQQMGIIPPLTPMPDGEANKAAVLRFYEELNRKHIGVIDELMTYDVIAHGDSLAATVQGRDAVKRAAEAQRALFPDLVIKVLETVADGNRVITRLRWTGTHMGAGFMGMPPTNKQMTWTGIATHSFENGQIAERWLNSDGFQLLRQFGIIPF